MQSEAQVRLVFAGEVLEGFQKDEVKRRFSEAFKLDAAKLAAMFSGQRTVLKRALSHDDAAHYVARLHKLGARIHVEPLAQSLPTLEQGTPSPAAVGVGHKPAAAPLLRPSPHPHLPPAGEGEGASSSVAPGLALQPAEEQIVCPTCGERQAKRILCRSCATDMPRGIAAKKEDEERARAERLEEARARRGLRPAASLAQAADDAPPLLGFGLEGRIARLPYLVAGLMSWNVLLALALMLLFHPSGFSVVVFLLGLLAVLLWSTRVTVLRLHDFNVTGWWSCVFVVPYVGEALSLALMFVPGSRDENDYGGQPRAGSRLAAGLLGLLFILIIAASWFPAVTALAQYMGDADESTTYESGGPSGPLPPDPVIAAHIRSPGARAVFSNEYWPGAENKAFAASQDGAWGWTAGQPSPELAVQKAMQDCDQHRQPYTRTCRLVNVDGAWVAP